MKLRRTLAVAVAAAVTTPVALIAATPAFADVQPASQAENRPTYEELKKAVADAQKAYDEAVAAKKKARQDLKDNASATYPLKAAKLAAEKAADKAATAEADAEKAVADAKAALEAAESDAEKAEAQKTLDAAEEKLAEAEEAKKKADAKAEAAHKAWIDDRVELSRKYGQAQDALEKATKAKEAAEKALATAKECVREPALTTLAEGLPSKIVAGTTVDFTLRVTNGTDRTLSVDPLVFVHEYDKQHDPLTAQWFDGSGWQTVDDESVYINRIENMEPGSHNDVKMRFEVDSKAGKADAFALFAGDASDAYNPCVLGPMKRYDFQIMPAGSDPGEVDDAKPEEPRKDEDERPGNAQSGSENDSKKDTEGGVSPQGGTSEEEAAPSGELATTGASSAPGQIALASAAAVALGAGAVFVVRRRRADQS